MTQQARGVRRCRPVRGGCAMRWAESQAGTRRERVTLMRARRSLVAVSVAALAALSLAACGRSAPDVAAYVGDTRYSVDRVDAICLSGGSAFGLGASDGTMRWLRERGRGVAVGGVVVPIVPTA